MPVTITVAAPVAAVLVAVNVRTVLVAAVVWLNTPVMPAGNPVTVKFAPPLNPFNAVNEIVLVTAAPPWVASRAAGDALNVKPGVLVTVMLIGAEAGNIAAAVPVIASCVGLTAAVDVKVRILVTAAVPTVRVAGLKAAVTPLGN